MITEEKLEEFKKMVNEIKLEEVNELKTVFGERLTELRVYLQKKI